MSTFTSASNITTEINSRNVSDGSLIFGIYGNSQKSITFNETCYIESVLVSVVISKLFILLMSIPTVFISHYGILNTSPLPEDFLSLPIILRVMKHPQPPKYEE